MHEGEDVGGWDTVLRREEYEALYTKQQASMSAPDFVEIIAPRKEVKADKIATVTSVAPKIEEKPKGPDWATILAPICDGYKVIHKSFGVGTVSWIDKAKKYIRISFKIDGKQVEKQFVFPDAFINGFLVIEQ